MSENTKIEVGSLAEPIAQGDTQRGAVTGATPCSLCIGLTMIPSDDPDGDIMNTPCPKCNEWSPDFKENPKGQGQA
jgi:hypothetical protein